MVDEARRNQRAKVESMVLRYQTATLGSFVETQSLDVSPGGTFVRTTEPLAPGTLLRFELQIATQRALHGVGRVVWKRDQVGASPKTPPGMGIKFIKIDSASRDAILRLSSESSAPRRGRQGNLKSVVLRLLRRD